MCQCSTMSCTDTFTWVQVCEGIGVFTFPSQWIQRHPGHGCKEDRDSAVHHPTRTPCSLSLSEAGQPGWLWTERNHLPLRTQTQSCDTPSPENQFTTSWSASEWHWSTKGASVEQPSSVGFWQTHSNSQQQFSPATLETNHPHLVPVPLTHPESPASDSSATNSLRITAGILIQTLILINLKLLIGKGGRSSQLNWQSF